MTFEKAQADFGCGCYVIFLDQGLFFVLVLEKTALLKAPPLKFNAFYWFFCAIFGLARTYLTKICLSFSSFCNVNYNGCFCFVTFVEYSVNMIVIVSNM